MPSYTQLSQAIHSLSLISNAGYGVNQYNSLAALKTFISNLVNQALTSDSVIQGCIGNWTPIWGPVVYSENADPNNPSDTITAPVVADNTMMLVQGTWQGQTVFVVAIAGTNIDSGYGWFKEDFHVDTTVAWQTVVPSSGSSSGFISSGTYTGFEILLNMKDNNGNTMLTSLNKALNGLTANSSVQVAVAGHSLGGALCPVLALYMNQTMSTWNTSKAKVTITAWPTAGPTPGDQNFATYLSNNLTYTSKYNTLDVVPHAWQQASMEVIPGIYSQNALQIPSTVQNVMGPLVMGALTSAVNTTTLKFNSYQPLLNRVSYTGTFDQVTDKKTMAEADVLVGTVPSDTFTQQYGNSIRQLMRFIAQLGYQHNVAYNGSNMLNIQAVADEFSKIKKAALGVSDEELHAQAVRRAVGRYLGMHNLAGRQGVAVEPEAVEAQSVEAEMSEA